MLQIFNNGMWHIEREEETFAAACVGFDTPVFLAEL